MKNYKQINELQKNTGEQLLNAFSIFKQTQINDDPNFILFCEAGNKNTSEERLLELVQHKHSSVSSKAIWNLEERFGYPMGYFIKD